MLIEKRNRPFFFSGVSHDALEETGIVLGRSAVTTCGAHPFGRLVRDDLVSARDPWPST